MRKIKLTEEDNCCGVIESEDQLANQLDDGKEGVQDVGQDGGEESVQQTKADQVHSRLNPDLDDQSGRQHIGTRGAGEWKGAAEE